MLGQGNAGAEGARRHGAELRRRWRMRRSGGRGVSAREDWLWVFIASVGASLLHLGGNARTEKAGIGLAGEITALGSWWPAWRLERASGPCPREMRPRGRTGGTGGVPRIHLAADESWTRSTGAYGRAAAEQRGEVEQGPICDF